MDVEPTLLAEPDAEDADSLVSSNEPDDLANEQTWPTEEEMAGPSHATIEGSIPDAKKGTTPKAVRRVPKGTSEYQAAWIVDESDDEDGEGDEAGSEAEMDDAEEQEEMVEMPVQDEDDTEMATDGRRSVHFQDYDDLDMEEEENQ
jgi:pre-rRNA-processing protein TSR1